MAEDSAEPDKERLKARLAELAGDPESYADFTDELSLITGNDFEKFATLRDGIGNSFDQAVDDVTLLQQRESLSVEVRALLQRFAAPSFLIRSDGRIVSRNEGAMQAYTLGDDARVTDLGFELQEAEPLTDLVVRVSQRRTGNQSLTLRRAHVSDADRLVTLVLMPSVVGADRAAGALMFVIDPVTRSEAVQLLTSAHGLTEAEAEILRAFGDGQTLKRIADQRGRSLATIRTQFQSLLDKTGTGSQAELMRSTQALSHFVHDLGDVVDVASHPNRRRFDVLRPGGRSVDVLVSGDQTGRPLVFMNGAFLHSFAPKIEAAFRDAGLCVVAIGRPGFGRTSTEPEGQSVADCVAEDVRAVLSQMGVTSAPALVHSTGIPVTLEIAQSHADLFETITIIGGMAPPRYMRKHASKSSGMAMSLLLAAGTSKRLLRLLLSGRHRMYMRLGPERFLHRQYAKAATDQALAVRPDLLKEYEAAVSFLMAQGYDPGIRELVSSQQDWDTHLDGLRTPVRVLHGSVDPLCPLNAMKDWVAKHPKTLTIDVLEGVGHYSLAARTDAVIAAVQRVAD